MEIITSQIKTAYQKKGFVLLKNVIQIKQIETLILALNSFDDKTKPYGIRDLMRKIPQIAELANSAPLLTVAQNFLGDNARPIRSVFFDKIPQANWNVAWHQDTSIAVSEQMDLSGFKLWTQKQGVTYVQPPEKYLENILTLRVHLDDAKTENGVLRVIAKTHQQGRINAANIATLVEQSNPVECIAKKGDILVMNPLLLHSSRKAIRVKHRRIIHLEYSTMNLPAPLKWHES